MAKKRNQRSEWRRISVSAIEENRKAEMKIGENGE
jgi:hypothetical protein